MKDLKAKWIKKLQELSTDGIAPSSSNDQLRMAAHRYSGSWEAFCKEAGVTPRNQQRKIKNCPEIDLLERLLIAAHNNGQKGMEVIERCIEVIREVGVESVNTF